MQGNCFSGVGRFRNVLSKGNGTLLYEGKWENGYLVKGRWYYDDEEQSTRYEGDWKEDEFHGEGTYYNSDGSIWDSGEILFTTNERNV